MRLSAVICRKANLSTGCLLALATLIVFVFSAGDSPAHGQPQLELSNGTMATSQLLVGEDLWAGLRLGTPGETYDFRLSSPEGTLIAGAYGRADAAGNVDPTRIWARSGVVGCDPGGPVESWGGYRFTSYLQAESSLAGKTLSLTVLTLSGAEVARRRLPVLTVAREIVYFSNASGCPRRIFKVGEPVYLAFLRPDRSHPSRRIFFTEGQQWPIGKPIVDVRGASQVSLLPAGGELVTLPLKDSQLVGSGSYDAIVRAGVWLENARLPTDQVLLERSVAVTIGPGWGEGSGGIVITQDGCPNCGGPSYP